MSTNGSAANKAFGEETPETHRKGRARQPSTSEEGVAAATSLQEEPHEGQPSVRMKLAQLTQAVATLQSQLQQAMPPTPSAHGHTRRLLSPEPDIDWETLRDELPMGPPGDLEDDNKIFWH
jgi:hypothetical protein